MKKRIVLTDSGGTPNDLGEKIKGAESLCSALCYFLLLGMFVLTIIDQPIRSEAQEPVISSEDEIPIEIQEYCEKVGEEFDICPELLEAMAYHESRFIPTVTNGNCWGLMQVNVKIHSDRIEKYDYTEEDLLEPYPNIVVAADFLAELYATYGDDNPIILSIYQGNWKAVSEYKEYGFLTEYVEDILTRSAKYERLHGK